MSGTGFVEHHQGWVVIALALTLVGYAAAQSQLTTSELPGGSQTAITRGPARRTSGRQLNRLLSSLSDKPQLEGLCFQPGVGWVMRHGTTSAETHPFQTVRIPRGYAARGTARLSRGADSGECDADTGVSSSQGALQGNVAAPAENSGSLAELGSGEMTYGFSPDQLSQTVSTRTSLTRNGDIVMSIVPGEMTLESRDPTTTLLDNEERMFESRSPLSSAYSFLPGLPQSADSKAGEHLSGPWGAIALYPDSFNRSQGYADSEVNSSDDSRNYWRIHRTCSELMDQLSNERNEPSSKPNSSSELNSGEDMQVARHRQACMKFLSMDKAAALRYLDKHHGLK